MRIGSLLRRGSGARITGSAIAAAGMTFIGLGTAGIGTITGGAASPNHCTAADALAKGGSSSKVISNDQGTCDVGGNSTRLPALGYVAFHLASGGTTTLRDVLQSDGTDPDFYVGTYTLSFSNLMDQTHSANAVTTTSGTYTLAPGTDEGESGGLASTYPIEPAVTGTLPTITGTAGDVVTAAYEVQYTATGPVESYSSEKNDIFFDQSDTQESQAASNSVKLLGADTTTSSTTTTTSSTPASTSINSSSSTSSSGVTSSSTPTTDASGTTDSTATTSNSSSDGVATSTSTSSSASTTGSDPPATSSSTTSSSSATSSDGPTTSGTTGSTGSTTTTSSASTGNSDPPGSSSSTTSTASTSTAAGDPAGTVTSTSSSDVSSSADPLSHDGSSSNGDPGSVLAAGTSTPSTGADIQFGGGLGLLTLGGGLIFGSTRLSRRRRP